MNEKNKSDDGGGAFPSYYGSQRGMRLRDYFAGKALLGEMITTLSDATPESAQAFADAMDKAGHTTVEQHLAFNAYKIADAMIAERERQR